MRTTALRITVALLAAITSRPAAAQGWLQYVDGSWGYQHDIEFVAQPFRCGNTGVLTCLADGNSLTIGDGTASFTMTVIPYAPQTVVATNVRRVMTLGEIRTRMTGTFVLPPPLSPQHTMFGFTMFLRSTVPVATSSFSGGITWNGTRTDSLEASVERSGVSLQTLLNPRGPSWGVVYYPFDVPTIAYEDGGVYRITVGVGLVPEPATTWLLLAGGAALLLLRRRLSSPASSSS